MMDINGTKFKETDRVYQFGFDYLNPKDISDDEIAKKVIDSLMEIGVIVVGAMPSDVSWTVKEYGF